MAGWGEPGTPHGSAGWSTAEVLGDTRARVCTCMCDRTPVRGRAGAVSPPLQPRVTVLEAGRTVGSGSSEGAFVGLS